MGASDYANVNANANLGASDYANVHANANLGASDYANVHSNAKMGASDYANTNANLGASDNANVYSKAKKLRTFRGNLLEVKDGKTGRWEGRRRHWNWLEVCPWTPIAKLGREIR